MELTNTNVRYLLTIYHLSQARLEVSSKDIAQTLDVSRASVTSMMSILTDKRLVTKERYGKVHLTDDGCRWARGTLLKIASAIAVLAAAIVTISLIDSGKLTASLGAITVLFAELMASMAIFSRISGEVKGVVKGTAAMIGVSTSVLLLSSALKKISDIEPEQMVVALAAGKHGHRCVGRYYQLYL